MARRSGTGRSEEAQSYLLMLELAPAPLKRVAKYLAEAFTVRSSVAKLTFTTPNCSVNPAAHSQLVSRLHTKYPVIGTCNRHTTAVMCLALCHKLNESCVDSPGRSVYWAHA